MVNTPIVIEMLGWLYNNDNKAFSWRKGIGIMLKYLFWICWKVFVKEIATSLNVPFNALLQ
jgi:hypothetical protein